VKELKEDYITPPEIAVESNQKALSVFQKAISITWSSYRQLLEAGIKPEIARYVLPNACTTEIICTWNFREIRHIIKLRTGPAALPEFQVVAEKIKLIMKKQASKIFGDL
jgi:thymidylate synthase (FAD)